MDRRFDFPSHGIAGFDRGPGINKAFDLDHEGPPHPARAGVTCSTPATVVAARS
jgi:hypothetical protein